MVDIVIAGHGDRGIGTPAGTYVVPKGVTIYFFTSDSQVLYDSAAELLTKNLCRNHPKTIAIQKLAVQKGEVKREFETVPNYTCYGTDDFNDPTGVYIVGQPMSAGPAIPIPDGQEKRLSDIIGGCSNGGVIGSNIYWMCCRASPDNSNNIDDDKDIVSGSFKAGTHNLDLGASEQGSNMGLKPSQVKQSGQWR